MQTTIDVLKANAEAAQAAFQAAQEAAREAQRKAYRDAEEAERQAKIAEYHTKVARALSPVEAMLDNVNIKHKLDGNTLRCEYNVTVRVESETTGGTAYRSGRSTGRFVIFVSTTSNKDVRFPPLTKGGHNVEKIVARVVETISEIKNKAAIEVALRARKAETADLAKALCAELNLSTNMVTNSYWVDQRVGATRHRSYEVVAPAGKVIVQLGNRTYNAEQVRVLAKALADIKALES